MNFSKRKLDPYFISLVQDCCLKSYHRKAKFAQFICYHSPERFNILPYTGVNTKREYLSDIFMNLVSRTDTTGHSFIYELAKSLVAMKSFPDLAGWEDSKIKIESAHKACELLRNEFRKLSELDKDEKEIVLRRKRAREQKEKQQYNVQAFEDIKIKLTELLRGLGSQKSGYGFEDWFYKLADYYEIENRRPYRDANGRQIDGSLTIEGITYLVEAKFTQKEIGSQDVDIFFNKIKSKADNTMGIMVSISGFNSNAVRTASCDRTTIILMDHSHVFNLIIPQLMTLREVIQRIARNAAQTGTSYLSAQDF